MNAGGVPQGPSLSGPRFTLQAAADQGYLIIYRRMLCRSPATRFLASDLVPFGDPYGWADQIIFACSKCKKREYVKVKVQYPQGGDYGHLEVRRPGPVRRIQTWRTVKLGD